MWIFLWFCKIVNLNNLPQYLQGLKSWLNQAPIVTPTEPSIFNPGSIRQDIEFPSEETFHHHISTVRYRSTESITNSVKQLTSQVARLTMSYSLVLGVWSNSVKCASTSCSRGQTDGKRRSMRDTDQASRRQSDSSW